MNSHDKWMNKEDRNEQREEKRERERERNKINGRKNVQSVAANSLRSYYDDFCDSCSIFVKPHRGIHSDTQTHIFWFVYTAPSDSTALYTHILLRMRRCSAFSHFSFALQSLSVERVKNRLKKWIEKRLRMAKALYGVVCGWIWWSFLLMGRYRVRKSTVEPKMNWISLFDSVETSTSADNIYLFEFDHLSEAIRFHCALCADETYFDR